ncbi:PilZ domain-containing protein [Streptomyces sp. NPDC048415]|uniref:PilZ domain-containing protein n=1 Tax=Streptomyces sp. NPDC048415 TaxID=3154822 RepID=UPI003414355D
MRGRREAEGGRQARTDVGPVAARVVTAVHTPVILQIQPIGSHRVLRDLVHALAELRVRVRQEHRGDTGVGRCPARPAVAGAEHAGGGDRDRDGLGVAVVGEDGVQPFPAAARHPLRARRVLPQRTDDVEGLAPVLRAVQRGRLRARVHDVRLGGCRVQLPHPLQRGPRVLGELDGRPARFGPCPAQVVGVEDGRPPVRAVPSGQQPRALAPGVDRHRVHGLRVEVRTLVELPGAAAPSSDEEPFASAYGEQYIGHVGHLRDVVVSDTGQSAPRH